VRRIEAARWLGFMPCCYCVRAGMDVLHLQALLGHASLDMVQHYAQMVNDDLIQAHQAHSPIDNLSHLR